MNYGMGHSPSLIIAFLSDIPFDFSESNMSVELSRKPGIYSTNNNQLNEVNIRFRVIRYSYRLSTRNRKVGTKARTFFVPPLRVVCPLSELCAPSHIIAFHSDIIILQKAILLTNSLIEYI